MIIFGLGNPGIRYRSTRHNAGYIFLDRFAKLYKKRFRMEHGYRIAKLEINIWKVDLIKPQCWMNQSGRAVSKILQDREGEFLVVVDDVNLHLGRIRLRSKGSDGGHLGLRSIISSLKTANFPRLRIGVGRLRDDISLYVLNPFTRKEKRILNSVIEEGIKGVEIMVRGNFLKAQNHINSININDIN